MGRGTQVNPTQISGSSITASTVVYADASKILTSLANAAGVLTNNGSGVLSWAWDGWTAATGTWTPRSQAFTNNPAAGANIELEMVDTSGFAVGDVIKVTSGAGSENALITVVHANTHLTVAALYLNHDTTTPSVKFADTLYVERAYTNDPAAGNNIELNMASTAGFAVGDLVEVSSSAGGENATVTVVHVDTHLTVNTLALNHTTTAPMVRQVVQNKFIIDTSVDLSASIGVQMKIKLTDSTVKYFIVYAIAATQLTLYGGKNYSVVSIAAVTSPAYSMVLLPFGFPTGDMWNTTVKAYIYPSIATNTTNAGWQKIPLNTALYDTGFIWDVVNKRLVPKIAGYYQITARIRTDTTGVLVVAISKNGSFYAVSGDTGGNIFAENGTGLVYCNGSTDYIEMYAYAVSARAITASSFDTHMQLLGPL